uniref:ribonuclease H n=1 Tax=Strongyloides venezuelensis TaxID=75913 RepID=A0A0K0FQN5_STRVS
MIQNLLTFYATTIKNGNTTIITFSRNASSHDNVAKEINQRLLRWKKHKLSKVDLSKKNKALERRTRKSVSKNGHIEKTISSSLSQKQKLTSNENNSIKSLSNPVGHVSRLQNYTGLVLKKPTDKNNNNQIFPTNQDNNKFNETIIGYTDASYIKGKPAGIGIFFGVNHPLNTSLLLDDVYNSCEAEIKAVQIALRSLAVSKYYRDQHIIIRTDFKGIIDAMDYGNDGRFGREYELVRSIAKYFPKGVTFEWIKGHNGDFGNEMADYLAKTATNARSRSRPSSENPNISPYINRSNSVTIGGGRNQNNCNVNLGDKIKDLVKNEEMYKKSLIKNQWNSKKIQ